MLAAYRGVTLGLGLDRCLVCPKMGLASFGYCVLDSDFVGAVAAVAGRVLLDVSFHGLDFLIHSDTICSISTSRRRAL